MVPSTEQQNQDFLSNPKFKVHRTLISVGCVVAIVGMAKLAYAPAAPVRQAIVGHVLAIDGKCGNERNCRFTVVAEKATMQVQAQPFDKGADGVLRRSAADGLVFCAATRCGRAAIIKADADVFRSLGFDAL